MIGAMPHQGHGLAGVLATIKFVTPCFCGCCWPLQCLWLRHLYGPPKGHGKGYDGKGYGKDDGKGSGKDDPKGDGKGRLDSINIKP